MLSYPDRIRIDPEKTFSTWLMHLFKVFPGLTSLYITASTHILDRSFMTSSEECEIIQELITRPFEDALELTPRKLRNVSLAIASGPYYTLREMSRRVGGFIEYSNQGQVDRFWKVWPTFSNREGYWLCMGCKSLWRQSFFLTGMDEAKSERQNSDEYEAFFLMKR